MLELGPDKVPPLVLAGKLGWDWEPVLAFVERTANLHGKLKILNGVSDSDLAGLYRNALFTLYCSHHEGWGLPVTESLSFGKVPVVPAHSGLAESGHEHAVFFRSNSEPALVQAVRPLLTDPDLLPSLEQRIRDRPPIRPWQAICDEIVTAVDGIEPAPVPPRHIVVGKVYRFGLRRTAETTGGPTGVQALQEFMATESLKGSGWHTPEEWGVRTSQENFTLEFELPTGEDLRASFVYLGLRGHEEEAELSFQVNGTALPPLFLSRLERRVARLPVPALAASERSITLACRQTGVYADRNDRKPRPRRIGVGAEFLMLCRANDVAARFSIVEEVAGLALLGS